MGVTASFPHIADAIGLSSMLQTGSPTSPCIDLDGYRHLLIAGFITPPVHRCPNETGLALNDGHLASCLNSDSKTRTYDLSFTKALLYQLSYVGKNDYMTLSK